MTQPGTPGGPPERARDRGWTARRSARWNIAHIDAEAPVPGSQSLHRALVLLNLVALMSAGRNEGVTLAELSRSSGRPKPSVHRVLSALTQAGYVERAPSGGYRLGLQALVLGSLAERSPNPLTDGARDSVIRLAAVSEDTAFLTIRQGAFSLCVQREEGSSIFRNTALGVGDRHPLGIGGGSLAILSAMDDAEVAATLERNADLLAQQYPRLTPDVLQTLVERSRKHGYALNEGLVAQGSWAMGVAIRNGAGEPVAALSIGAIEGRLGPARREELLGTMRAEVDHIESELAREDPRGVR